MRANFYLSRFDGVRSTSMLDVLQPFVKEKSKKSAKIEGIKYLYASHDYYDENYTERGIVESLTGVHYSN